jgi:hypothetical protein
VWKFEGTEPKADQCQLQPHVDKIMNMRKKRFDLAVLRTSCWMLFLALNLPLFAQNLDQLYMDSLRSKNNSEQSEKDNKDKLEKFISEAKDKGMYWKCKSLYVFYGGYVLIGSKDDGSDVGKPPFDLVGKYYSQNDFTSFTFPSLPFENTYELNVKNSELVIYRKTLNKLDKVACNFLK